MNIGSAKEILESAEVVPVSYKGSQVIIQRIDDVTKMARIYFRKNPDEERDVPILNLIEESW